MPERCSCQSPVRGLWRAASRGCRRAAGLHNVEQGTSATCGDVGPNWAKNDRPSAGRSLLKPRASPLLLAASLSYFPNILFNFSIPFLVSLRSVFPPPGQAFPDVLGVLIFLWSIPCCSQTRGFLAFSFHPPGAATRFWLPYCVLSKLR